VIRKGKDAGFMQQAAGASPGRIRSGLRLYQAADEGLVPAGAGSAVVGGLLLRPVSVRLAYHGAEAMFARANRDAWVPNWTTS